MWRRLLLTLVAAGSACSNPFASTGGTIHAHVRDQNNAPVPGAGVAVSQVNGSGGSFSVSQATRSDGTTTLGGVQTGSHTVTVSPPAGYAAGADAPSKTVTVEKGRTVEVEFVLLHSR